MQNPRRLGELMSEYIDRVITPFEQAWFADAGYDIPPPEQHACSVCDGTGRETTELTVAQLIRLVRSTRREPSHA